MDDWQEAAFSSRHMHNRGSGNGAKHGGKSSSFNVRKTFGSYECKCAAWQKMNSAAAVADGETAARLEIYRLTANGQGVVGQISLPGVLRASLILAASRKSLQGIMDGLEVCDEQQGTDEGEDGDDNDDDGAESNREEREVKHLNTFEKNSFRSPKFWFRWSGVPVLEDKAATVESGLGYVVFSGNECRKFKGTISCELLGWRDVALAGYKIASRSDSDVPVTWEETILIE